MKHINLIIKFLFFLIAPQIVNGQIKGSILDLNGQALVGASILVKGTQQYAIADSDGKFELTPVAALPVTIQINALGYQIQEIEFYEWPDEQLEIVLKADNLLSSVVVTARRRAETAQDIPIPVSIIAGQRAEDAGAFNVNRLKEMVPSVQMYSSNPRNTGINIRGLGSPFGLTNDGLDPGVGFYVDGVYYARPAAATLDFLDIERIEVLRGPQGTLFGKNTTSGAFNITTRKASFKPGASLEVGFGNFGFIQAKASVTGPIIKNKLAARISFSGTQRNGTVYNVAKDEFVNDINNLGVRAQLLYKPSDAVTVSLSGDHSGQYPNGYAQVIAGVTETKRPSYRQFNQIISDLNYNLPSRNAFDRLIDHDTPWRSLNELGGLSLNADIKLGKGVLTSTTAWRYWNWGPSNDRDFTSLQVLAKSQNPSEHRNWSQELRYSNRFTENLSGVIGLFYIDQTIRTHGTEESGSSQWRFSQSSTSPLWQTPGLLDGYGAKTESSIASQSAAIFVNVDWEVFPAFHLQPGLRYNYDNKDVVYDRKVSGGLETSDPALLALKNGVYSNQFFEAGANETNYTYQLTSSFKINKRINTYASYSTSYKPIGVNVAGLPVINGEVAIDLGTIKPEFVQHLEAGFKSRPKEDLIFNISVFRSSIKDYQTNVQSPQIGVNRGYIANAEQVLVQGMEADGIWQKGEWLSINAAISYTDGKYIKFTNAPLPLEDTGLRDDEGNQIAFRDISGSRLPGISKWSGAFGGELKSRKSSFIGLEGIFFLGVDYFYRSEFSSSSSPSRILNIDGYGLVNLRTGFRADNGWNLQVWTRNLANRNYYEQLLAAGGNAGHYAAVLGDPRTYGVTLKFTL